MSASRHQRVLNHGHVTLHEHFGNDLTIVNAARQSYNRKSNHIDASDIGLINYLLKHRHGSPLEMVNFRFTVKLPISVMREWIRHRMASYNERSGRYTKLDPEFFIPSEFRKQVGKPGHYTFEPLEPNMTEICREDMEYAYKTSWDVYESLLRRGVAKEVARSVLPVGIYTQFAWNINLRSLFNFLSLRTDVRAMQEIREYADVIENMIKVIVPHTHKAWDDNGRSNP